MKKMMWALVALVCFGTMVDVLAGSFPVKAIRSRNELKSYALEQSRYGYAGVYSPSILPGDNHFSWVETDTDYTKLPGLLNAETLKLQVANVRDVVDIRVMYCNTQGWAVLEGNTQSYLEKDEDGKWVLPSKAGDVSVHLNDYTPIITENVSSIEMIIRNDDGDIVDYQYPDIYDNIIYFPTALAGVQGEIILTYNDGGTSYSEAYDIESGLPIDNGAQSVSPVVSVEGLEIVPTNQRWVNSNPISNDGVGTSPLVQVTFEGSWKRYDFYAYASTTEGEVPSGFFIRKMGETDPVYYPVTPGRYTYIRLYPGVYHIDWQWNYFHEPEDGDGKG